MKLRKALPVVAIALIVILALALAGCQGGTTTTPATSEKPRTTPEVKTLKQGTISFGSDTAFPPFEFGTAGNYQGFDVDLGKEVAKRLGLTYEIISTAWDGIIPGLKANKYDAITSAMTITADREKEMSVTDPYILSNQSIAVMKGSAIKAPADLKGKRVGVQVDTTGQLQAEKILGKNYPNLKKYKDTLTAFADLNAGRLDAIVNDLPVSLYIVNKTYKGKMEIAATIETNEGYGIWFKKDNTQLRDAVNKVLKEMEADGTYNKIYKKWFGVEPETKPETSPTQPAPESEPKE